METLSANNYFLWERKDTWSKKEGTPFRGTCARDYKEILGRDGFVFKLEELLKLPFSESLKKRLRGARPGTAVKIQKFSRNDHLYLRRLTDEEVVEWQECRALKKRDSQLTMAINEAVPDLIEKQKEVRARLRKIKKAWHDEA